MYVFLSGFVNLRVRHLLRIWKQYELVDDTLYDKDMLVCVCKHTI